MNRNNDMITSDQLFSIIVTLIIGIGILSLPRALADKAGPDSLLIILVGSLLFLGLAIITVKLANKFPKSTIVEMGNELVGKPIGKILGLLYFIYLMGLIILEIRAFGAISKHFLLLSTPIEIIMITFLIASIYLVRSGIETISRMAVIILPLSLIPAMITLLITMPDLDVTNFLPILKTPPMDLLKAIPEVAFSFLGFEFILFIGFFVKDNKKIGKVSIWAIFTVTIVYFLTVFFTIGKFGIQETKNLVWPVVTVFKSIDIPGTILENVEVVIMGTWLLSIFMTVSITYFGAVFLLSRLLDSKEHNYLTIPLFPIIYILALIPENAAQVYDYLGMYSYISGTVFAIAIPILLFIISLFKKKANRGRGKSV